MAKKAVGSVRSTSNSRRRRNDPGWPGGMPRPHVSDSPGECPYCGGVTEPWCPGLLAFCSKDCREAYIAKVEVGGAEKCPDCGGKGYFHRLKGKASATEEKCERCKGHAWIFSAEG